MVLRLLKIWRNQGCLGEGKHPLRPSGTHHYASLRVPWSPVSTPPIAWGFPTNCVGRKISETETGEEKKTKG